MIQVYYFAYKPQLRIFWLGLPLVAPLASKWRSWWDGCTSRWNNWGHPHHAHSLCWTKHRFRFCKRWTYCGTLVLNGFETHRIWYSAHEHFFPVLIVCLLFGIQARTCQCRLLCVTHYIISFEKKVIWYSSFLVLPEPINDQYQGTHCPFFCAQIIYLTMFLSWKLLKKWNHNE